MNGSILGNRVRRTEDPELLTSGGTYVYDLPLDRPLHAVFVRSDVAHAKLLNVDLDEASLAGGVVAVFSAAELGLAPHHGFMAIDDAFLRPPLATDRVRFVGDPVALVLAESFTAAVDGAELVTVSYEPLPAVVDPERALDADATLLFEPHGSNVAVAVSDDEVTDVFDAADVVVRGRYLNQRVAAVPMEPNSAAAVPTDDGRITLYAATQMPHLLQRQLAAALDRPEGDVRVIAPHVGGGFGAKAGIYHEFSAIAAAAIKLGRPVTWTETRSEDMVALVHSRGQIQYAELACNAEGDFLGLRIRIVGDAGAYPNIGAFLPTLTKRMGQGPYAVDHLQFDYVVAATTTTPMGAYRGAGRPEATSLLERLVDQAAIELGIDPLVIRERNLLADDVFPFPTLTGVTYDSGEYRKPLRVAAEMAGYEELRAEQRQRRDSGATRQLGVGVASYVEVTSGGGGSEFGAVRVNTDGSATMTAGTSAHGQGHQTTYAMIVSEATGIPVEQIDLIQSDTDRVRSGGGTGGSRSLQLAGSAVANATEAMVGKAKALAAHLLEASEADIVVNVEQGTVGVAGVPARDLSWAELAIAAEAAPDGVVDHGDGTDGLAAQLDFQQADGTFPFGAHISVVEVDLDTGAVDLIRHIAVDDAGNQVNPLLVEGQQHGGIAQGAAQALYEHYVYDDDGNPLTGSLMNYAIPSAAEFPAMFEVASTTTPTPLNPLGVKGIGEAATIGATPAVQNAVIDALAHLGVRHIDMPCTPERVWETIRQAEAGDLPDPWREPPEIFQRLDEFVSDDD
jgi:carbon-monoxide dehydrogenase large subunit